MAVTHGTPPGGQAAAGQPTAPSIVPAGRPDGEGVIWTPDGPRLTGLAPHLAALVQCTVASSPQAEAIADLGTGRRLGYAGLWDGASRVAGGLLAAGVRPGDRVAIRLPNGADWCLAFLGATLAGAIPVPVNTRLTPAEVEFIVRDSGASAVLDGLLPDGPPAASAGPKPSTKRHCSAADSSARCDSTAPLGRPVVPLV